MTSVEIIVGHSWKEDVRFLSDARLYRPIESSVNLIEIRDIIDIVVDGNNITSNIAEESIFGVFGELLDALYRLVNGQSQKAIIEFHCEPWELVLVPQGRDLLVSVYSVDRHHRVVADNMAIGAEAFVEAVTEAAETMLTDLFRISERFSADSFVRRFSSQLAQLKRQRSMLFAPAAKGHGQGHGERAASTSCGSGLTLGYAFDGDWPHLSGYCGEHVFDLHTLLFPGTVEAEVDGRSVTLTRVYPYLCVVSMLGRARELLNFLEVKEEVFDCVEAMPYGHFDVYGRGNLWSIHIESDQACDAALDVDAHPHDCLDSLLTLAELFVKDLLNLNAHLELNQRLVDLDEEVRNLRGWQQELCGNNLYLDKPEDYLRRQGHLEPRVHTGAVKPSFAWPLASVRALFPRIAWQYEANQIEFEHIVTAEDTLIVASVQALVSVERATGIARWSHTWAPDSEQAARFAMAGDFAVVAESGRGLRLIDWRNGQEQAASATLTRWSGLLGAAHFAAEGVVVVADLSGRIVGIASEDARSLWEHTTGGGRFSSIAICGPLVSVISTESYVSTLNPVTGEILWKVRLGGLPDVAPQYHQGRLYCFTHDLHHRTVTVHAFYPFTGRSVWQMRLAGAVVGRPCFMDQWLVLPMERHGRIVIEGIDIEANHPHSNWQLEVSSAGLYQPTAIQHVHIDGESHGVVKTDRAELTCFRLRDGFVRWQIMPATETLLLYGNLPLILIDDTVLVVNDSLDLHALDTGQLLHSFYPVEAPEFVSASGGLSIVVGEQGAHLDDVDTLTGLTLGHFLALVSRQGG
ncbi:MAG: PQQ-binding-like beta-propeller repeat protein [Bradymonadaceae bacterium]|nr:PQQ-binding-like beta-propeller repeat protein [Lujinxingiaceae bacterium]